MKMEPIVSSETSAIRTQTPGNYPKRNNLHLEHGESLRTRSALALGLWEHQILYSHSYNKSQRDVLFLKFILLQNLHSKIIVVKL